jgi:hypothetical protein
MFDKKAQAAAALATLEAQLHHMKEENTFLRRQVEKLQEALFAKESPLAYAKMKEDEAALADPAPSMSEKDVDYRRIESEVLTNRMMNSEKSFLDVFEGDPEALLSALGKTIGAPESAPIHNNDES